MCRTSSIFRQNCRFPSELHWRLLEDASTVPSTRRGAASSMAYWAEVSLRWYFRGNAEEYVKNSICLQRSIFIQRASERSKHRRLQKAPIVKPVRRFNHKYRLFPNHRAALLMPNDARSDRHHIEANSWRNCNRKIPEPAEFQRRKSIEKRKLWEKEEKHYEIERVRVRRRSHIEKEITTFSS